MKKRIACLLAACLMVFGSISLAGCAGAKKPDEGTVTRMTVDINPSVEFMIDDQNKVISATALNDDGSILIAGEAFVGKTPEEAVELVVSLSADTGYLVKGNVTADQNTVKISVSGDTKYAEKLTEKVTAKAEDVLKKLDIPAKIEQVEAMGLEALRALALSTSLYTEEEIKAMNEQQLCKVLAEGRVETALLLTEEMQKAYFAAKEYEISFAESEETAKVIEGMGNAYIAVHSAYTAAVNAYSQAIEKLDTMRYNTLVAPDSAYQKALATLRESKAEFLKERTYVASLDVNGETYASAQVTLKASEDAYNAAVVAFEAIGKSANTAMEALINTLKAAETRLRELENTLFTDDIKAKLKEKATETENALNTAKDNFFTAFEEEHGADITAVKDALLAKKAQLKESVKNPAA